MFLSLIFGNDSHTVAQLTPWITCIACGQIDRTQLVAAFGRANDNPNVGQDGRCDDPACMFWEARRDETIAAQDKESAMSKNPNEIDHTDCCGWTGIAPDGWACPKAKPHWYDETEETPVIIEYNTPAELQGTTVYHDNPISPMVRRNLDCAQYTQPRGSQYEGSDW